MAKKTYYPSIVRFLRALCTYIARYRTQLEKYLTAEFGASAVTALNAIVVACEAFLAIVTLTENS